MSHNVMKIYLGGGGGTESALMNNMYIIKYIKFLNISYKKDWQNE